MSIDTAFNEIVGEVNKLREEKLDLSKQFEALRSEVHRVQNAALDEGNKLRSQLYEMKLLNETLLKENTARRGTLDATSYANELHKLRVALVDAQDSLHYEKQSRASEVESLNASNACVRKCLDTISTQYSSLKVVTKKFVAAQDQRDRVMAALCASVDQL